MDFSFLSGLTVYTENFIPVCVILVLICLLEWLIPRIIGFRSSASHQILKVVFAVYLLVLFEMTVSLRSLWRSYLSGWVLVGEQMWVPFQEIRSFVEYGSREEILYNLVGNVAGFLPMGLLPPLLWKWSRHPLAALAWAFLPSCVIEFLQLFTPRTTSVDDIILNAAGALLGYLCFWILHAFGIGKGTILVWKRKRKASG